MLLYRHHTIQTCLLKILLINCYVHWQRLSQFRKCGFFFFFFFYKADLYLRCRLGLLHATVWLGLGFNITRKTLTMYTLPWQILWRNQINYIVRLCFADTCCMNILRLCIYAHIKSKYTYLFFLILLLSFKSHIAWKHMYTCTSCAAADWWKVMFSGCYATNQSNWFGYCWLYYSIFSRPRNSKLTTRLETHKADFKNTCQCFPGRCNCWFSK